MFEHLANLYSMLKVKAVKVSVEIIIIVLIYTAGDLRDSCIIRGTAHTAGTALGEIILVLKQ